MSDANPEGNPNEAIWRHVLEHGYVKLLRKQRLFSHLPSEPRCAICYTPFRGVGGLFLRNVLGYAPSNYNPAMCNACEELVIKHRGGAEVQLSMMFADVRGSTAIAEGMAPVEFSRLMDRFYTAATHAVMPTRGLIEKFVGDSVTMLFTPGIAGPDHAAKAIESARLLLEATDHGRADGPWLPVGAGVHTGVAFVGSVGSGGVVQLAALGDAVNAAARLASNAAAGEILVSDDACAASGLDRESLEHRNLQLKGRNEPMGVYVLRLASSEPVPQG